jgi:hypothetical protein
MPQHCLGPSSHTPPRTTRGNRRHTPVVRTGSRHNTHRRSHILRSRAHSIRDVSACKSDPHVTSRVRQASHRCLRRRQLDSRARRQMTPHPRRRSSIAAWASCNADDLRIFFVILLLVLVLLLLDLLVRAVAGEVTHLAALVALDAVGVAAATAATAATGLQVADLACEP